MTRAARSAEEAEQASRLAEELAPVTYNYSFFHFVFALASMYLAMWAKVENRALDTYQVDIGWDELSPKNDKETADTIKTLVEGLVTGMEAGLISVNAAAEFLREFVPSMLPWADPDGDDDERRRVAASFTLMQRLQDGQGLPSEGGQEPGQGGEA